VLCLSPNSVVVDAAVADEAKRQFTAQGGYFLSPAETDALAKLLVTPQRLPNPKFVGKSAVVIAKALGITVPADTRALIAELKGVGRDFPLSIEKLCPVLSYYVVADWREGCERCKEILRYGGMGHTMSIHSQNEAVILEFGLKKPAFRICVNTPTTHGSIGLTTGLDPAMTLDAVAMAATSRATTSRRSTCSIRSAWPGNCGRRREAPLLVHPNAQRCRRSIGRMHRPDWIAAALSAHRNARGRHARCPPQHRRPPTNRWPPSSVKKT
jgi:hypothetical protein